MTPAALPAPQRAMLEWLRADGMHPAFNSREVQIARALERRGLVTVTDNGYIRGEREAYGHSERWDVRITDAGRAALEEP